MKKRALLGALLVAIAVATTTALASNNTPTQCGGKLIVNVTYGLFNDYDSGVGGNAWANDTIKRHLQVFDLGGGDFCAVVNDTGSFVTFAGRSPSGEGIVSAGITGVINGGYVTTVFAGTLNPSPTYAMKGNVGSFDLACTDAYTCPGARPSFLSYVSTSSYDLASWGWTYHTAQNGDWVNADSGNVGDITG